MTKKQKWIVSERWQKLTREQQIDEVSKEMAKPGTTNKTAATALGATPGMVAGIRYKNDIPSTNSAGGRAQVAEVIIEVAPAEAPTRKPVAKSPKRPPLKLAASEATQCKHPVTGGKFCSGAREPGSDYCEWHQEDELAQKRKQ